MKIRWFLSAVALAAMPAVHALAQTSSSRPAITGISHICVYSSDPAKTEAFYVHDLGAVKRADPENAQGTRYYFSATQFVEVLPLPAGYASINRLDHVAFKTKDAEALRKYLSARGYATPAQVQTGSDGSRWFEVEDPEGNKVEFVQPPANPDPAPPNPLSSHIIHVGYIVHSEAAENTFYRSLLGFRPYWYGGMNDQQKQWISQQVPDGTDWIEYMMVQGPETRGIPPGMSANSLGTLNHFSLGVQNIEKAAILLYAGDRLCGRNAGSGPKIGRDGKWQYNLYDPDGTRAEIMEFQPVAKPCCSEFTAASPTE